MSLFNLKLRFEAPDLFVIGGFKLPLGHDYELHVKFLHNNLLSQP